MSPLASGDVVVGGVRVTRHALDRWAERIQRDAEDPVVRAEAAARIVAAVSAAPGRARVHVFAGAAVAVVDRENEQVVVTAYRRVWGEDFAAAAAKELKDPSITLGRKRWLERYGARAYWASVAERAGRS